MPSRRPGTDGGRAAARGAQSRSRLRELQRLTAGAILRPLDSRERTQRTWVDGRPMKTVAAEFIKPNDRLTSLERLEIYNRQYWFRVLDCLYDDYPGLHAILGERKFHKLRVAYLAKYPSRCFTLRNLGSRLERFLIEEPRWAKPRQQISIEMARFEWAQIVAFDGEERPVLTVDDLLGKDPARLRLGLQPYLTLLEMQYPLDDFLLTVKKRNATLRAEASNAVDGQHTERRMRQARLPRPERVFLAVHRFENDLYYKRLDEPQYRLLCSIRDGATLDRACTLALKSARVDQSGEIQEWFRNWMELRWFCKRS